MSCQALLNKRDRLASNGFEVSGAGITRFFQTLKVLQATKGEGRGGAYTMPVSALIKKQYLVSIMRQGTPYDCMKAWVGAENYLVKAERSQSCERLVQVDRIGEAEPGGRSSRTGILHEALVASRHHRQYPFDKSGMHINRCFVPLSALPPCCRHKE